MRVLITGICGFVGSTLARTWLEQPNPPRLVGIDNLSRAGSAMNVAPLTARGIQVIHGDIRSAADLDATGDVDWIIDAAARPSVLAGIDGKTSSRQLVEHNLLGTVNLLELCRARRAGFTLLSTSRVYAIAPLAALKLRVAGEAYEPDPGQSLPAGCSPRGVAEDFSVTPPLSLYGATKLASETLALEYGSTFDFPVFINRCGVMAGAGQFAHAEQGIVAYWLHAWRAKRPLTYIGFDGRGRQVRDALHPADLLDVLAQQMRTRHFRGTRVCNFAGGAGNAFSLAALSRWCAERWGPHTVASQANNRPFDVPWLVLDGALAEQTWQWRPRTTLPMILQEIADFADANPDWLDRCNPGAGGKA